MAKFKVSYVYELSAATKAEAKERMAKARSNGTDEELFSYVSIREVEHPSLINSVVKQIAG